MQGLSGLAISLNEGKSHPKLTYQDQGNLNGFKLEIPAFAGN